MNNNYIHFPLYGKGRHGCLEELVVALKNNREPKLWIHICDIVEYNVMYRDCLRENGIDGLIEQMCTEAPSFRNEEEAIKELKKWYSKLDRIAGYDIQCYGIEDTFDVLGKTFHGLQEIRSRVEMFARGGYNELHTFSQEKNADSPDGLHIGLLYRDYPKFDSYDEADDRTYDNYIIRRERITELEMRKLAKIPSLDNAKRMHEWIPADMLPILYYGGSEDYILLATAKEQQHEI